MTDIVLEQEFVRPLRWWHRWFPAKCDVPPRCVDGTREHHWSEELVTHDTSVHLCVHCLYGWHSMYYRGPDKWYFQD